MATPAFGGLKRAGPFYPMSTFEQQSFRQIPGRATQFFPRIRDGSDGLYGPKELYFQNNDGSGWFSTNHRVNTPNLFAISDDFGNIVGLQQRPPRTDILIFGVPGVSQLGTISSAPIRNVFFGFAPPSGFLAGDASEIGNFDIPSGSTITGIEFEITRSSLANNATSGVLEDCEVLLFTKEAGEPRVVAEQRFLQFNETQPGFWEKFSEFNRAKFGNWQFSSGNNPTNPIPTGDQFSSTIYGGPFDLWGLDSDNQTILNTGPSLGSPVVSPIKFPDFFADGIGRNSMGIGISSMRTKALPGIAKVVGFGPIKEIDSGVVPDVFNNIATHYTTVRVIGSGTKFTEIFKHTHPQLTQFGTLDIDDGIIKGMFGTLPILDLTPHSGSVPLSPMLSFDYENINRKTKPVKIGNSIENEPKVLFSYEFGWKQSLLGFEGFHPIAEIISDTELLLLGNVAGRTFELQPSGAPTGVPDNNIQFLGDFFRIRTPHIIATQASIDEIKMFVYYQESGVSPPTLFIQNGFETGNVPLFLKTFDPISPVATPFLYPMAGVRESPIDSQLQNPINKDLFSRFRGGELPGRAGNWHTSLLTGGQFGFQDAVFPSRLDGPRSPDGSRRSNIRGTFVPEITGISDFENVGFRGIQAGLNDTRKNGKGTFDTFQASGIGTFDNFVTPGHLFAHGFTTRENIELATPSQLSFFDGNVNRTASFDTVLRLANGTSTSSSRIASNLPALGAENSINSAYGSVSNQIGPFNNLGFNIPSGALITGIEVKVLVVSSINIQDESIKLVLPPDDNITEITAFEAGGRYKFVNKFHSQSDLGFGDRARLGENWIENGVEERIYGGQFDLWDFTPGSITPEIVNKAFKLKVDYSTDSFINIDPTLSLGVAIKATRKKRIVGTAKLSDITSPLIEETIAGGIKLFKSAGNAVLRVNPANDDFIEVLIIGDDTEFSQISNLSNETLDLTGIFIDNINGSPLKSKQIISKDIIDSLSVAPSSTQVPNRWYINEILSDTSLWAITPFKLLNGSPSEVVDNNIFGVFGRVSIGTSKEFLNKANIDEISMRIHYIEGANLAISTLFVSGPGKETNNLTLFMQAPIPATGSITLVTFGPIPASSIPTPPLFISGPIPASSVPFLPLYTQGPIPVSGVPPLTLFTSGPSPFAINDNIPLVTKGQDPVKALLGIEDIDKQINLFLQSSFESGGPTATLNLVTFGPTVGITTSNMNLVLTGAGIPVSNSMTLVVNNIGFSSGVPLFIRAPGTTAGAFPASGDMSLFIKRIFFDNNSVPLFLSVAENQDQITLFTEGGFLEATGSIPLTMPALAQVKETLTLFIRGF